MEFFGNALTKGLHLLLSPLAFLGPTWSLILVSTIVGLALVWLYGRVSDQKAIARVKRSIGAGIYESVLFRHDLRTSLRAQLGMFWGGVRYFCIAIPPILILMIPCILILAQLNLYFGYRPLKSGESAIVSLQVSDDESLFNAELLTPRGISVTPPLRDLDTQQVSWRLDLASNPVPAEPMVLRIGDASGPLHLASGVYPLPVTTEIHTSPWWQMLFPSPGMPGTLAQYAQRLSISYPESELSVGGLQTHWLLLFIVVSIVAGLVGSKIFGIEV